MVSAIGTCFTGPTPHLTNLARPSVSLQLCQCTCVKLSVRLSNSISLNSTTKRSPGKPRLNRASQDAFLIPMLSRSFTNLFGVIAYTLDYQAFALLKILITLVEIFGQVGTIFNRLFGIMRFIKFTVDSCFIMFARY